MKDEGKGTPLKGNIGDASIRARISGADFSILWRPACNDPTANGVRSKHEMTQVETPKDTYQHSSPNIAILHGGQQGMSTSTVSEIGERCLDH